MNADILIRNGSVFDSVSDEPYGGYVAISGNRIMETGQGDGAALAGPNTKVIDAKGGTVMAGFHDSHTHLLMAGMYTAYPNLSDCRSEEEAVARMVAAAETGIFGGEDSWVIGFGWYHVFWDNKQLPSHESLDAAFPDRPVMLLNAEAHGVWVNSKAMRIAGIDENTPDPKGGEILRRPDGRPSGILSEGASGLVTKYACDFDAEREKELIGRFMAGAAANGITSICDVMPYFHGNMGHIPVYSQMDRSGSLTVRIHAAPDLLGDLDEVVEWQRAYSSEKLKVAHVKQFLDGVSTTHTALMLEPYADDPQSRGIAMFPLSDIRRAVPEAHRRGLSVKLHSCGDASARFALDCYEEAINNYGKNDCRHAIEHCEYIDGEDIPRFGELGAVPSVQPEHLALTQSYAENPYRETMGEKRAGRCWRYRSLLRSSGHIAIGSDCPVVNNNPFLEIYRGISRVHDDGEPAGGWNPEEKLTLAEVLRGYTLGSAWAALREGELGSIESGKLADIIIIDRDLFASEPREIKKASVSVTIFDGRVVYEK
ncbi:MAG: amidohydrolase [Clostridiales Family XIII bacterium]|nr:amidohydrolase [Clostridiales Family XIII bacterium]